MTRNPPPYFNTLRALGMSTEDIWALRRICMMLQNWYAACCGVETGKIDRDEITGWPYWWPRYGSPTDARRIPDREKGAKRRLAKIMARYPTLTFYIQDDPRGCALYILRPSDVPEGADPDSCYTNGIAITRHAF